MINFGNDETEESVSAMINRSQDPIGWIWRIDIIQAPQNLLTIELSILYFFPYTSILADSSEDGFSAIFWAGFFLISTQIKLVQIPFTFVNVIWILFTSTDIKDKQSIKSQSYISHVAEWMGCWMTLSSDWLASFWHGQPYPRLFVETKLVRSLDSETCDIGALVRHVIIYISWMK